MVRFCKQYIKKYIQSKLIMKNEFTIKACPVDYLTIRKRDFDPKEYWYAYISGYNPKIGKTYQIRFKRDVNRIKNLEERKIEMSGLLEALKEKINSGWNPFTNQYADSETNDIKTLYGAIDYIVQLKTANSRKKTIEGYTYAVKLFKDWSNQNSFAEYIHQSFFKPKHALAFMDYLITEKKYAAKSHNNILIFMRSIFNAMVDRELVAKNPFAAVKKLPVETGKNVAFTEDEAFELDRVIWCKNIRLWFFKEFMYCAAIRRTELTLLKVRDIMNMSILMGSDISKNKKQESVAINQRLKIVIEMMELHKYDPNDFVFGRHLETCSQQFINPNHITTAHTKIAKSIGIREECTLYSWKYTGAINLYNLTKDPYLLMRHLRHHSLEMTMIYLRSLGILSDSKLTNLKW